jgi:hypothetical protein
LLDRASRDGFQSWFLSSSLWWSSENIHNHLKCHSIKKMLKSFLFTLKNQNNIDATICPLKEHQKADAIYDHHSHGSGFWKSSWPFGMKSMQYSQFKLYWWVGQSDMNDNSTTCWESNHGWIWFEDSRNRSFWTLDLNHRLSRFSWFRAVNDCYGLKNSSSPESSS